MMKGVLVTATFEAVPFLIWSTGGATNEENSRSKYIEPTFLIARGIPHEYSIDGKTYHVS